MVIRAEGERAMWLAVLETFLVDAAKIKQMPMWNEVGIGVRERAWSEFKKDLYDQDVKLTCDYLGVEYDKFIRKVLDVYRIGKYKQTALRP